MLQALIQRAVELDEATSPIPLVDALLGSLAYLPLEIGLAGLADALGWTGWPLPPGRGEQEVSWERWPLGWLPAAGGACIAVRPPLLLHAPGRVLVVEGSWREDGEALARRLDMARSLARQHAVSHGIALEAEAALLSAHLVRPLAPPGLWASWATLHAALRHRAARHALAPGPRRLLDDLGNLLLQRGQGGPAGLAGLERASPPLCSAHALHRWRIEEPWSGWLPLAPGPGEDAPTALDWKDAEGGSADEHPG